MPPTTTTISEQIAASGPIGPSTALLSGIVLSLVFAWALWRESRVLTTWYAVLFWLLRSVTVAIVLWMLMAPTKVLVETSTTRRSIVIATDVSDSMRTVDAAGTSDDMRWELARIGHKPFSITREADESVAAMGIALRQLKVVRESVDQRRERSTVDAVSAASKALQHVKGHLKQLLNSPASRTSSVKSHSLLKRLDKMLDAAELQSFEKLSASIQKNRTPSERGWQEGLTDLEHRLTVIRTVLQELARSMAADEEPGLVQATKSTVSGEPGGSRLDKATRSVATLKPQSLDTLRELVDVRYASFDKTVHWVTGEPAAEQVRTERPEPSATGTDLTAVFEALGKERQQQPCAAVFLFSDVGHNQSGNKNPVDVASTLQDTPVYVIPVGNPLQVRDIRLRSIFAPTVAMRNDDIVIEASIQAFDCDGEPCVVQLLKDGVEIDRREITFDSGLANRTVHFEQQVPTLGTEHFKVAIVPVEGEVSTDNNDRDFEVNVTRNDIKILLADEYPRWEYRYLAQLFRRDTKAECDELLFHPRLVATGSRQATKAMPMTVEEWDRYDVVILGDLSAAHLPVASQESLAQYLQHHSGTLVLIAGQDAMPHAYKDQPLSEILPVSPIDHAEAPGQNGYEFRLTAEGREHQALMIGETEEENRVAWDLVNRRLPIPVVSDWRRPRATAHTLISAVSRNSSDPVADESRSAFLCWHPVGRGRVVYLSGPETWRMRMLRGDRLHYRFWGQLLRWAIASDLATGTSFVRVRTDKSRYATNDIVAVIVRLTNAEGEPVVADGVAARVTGDGESRTISLAADPQIPGEYRGDIRSLSPGEYRIVPVGDAVDGLQTDGSQEPASIGLTVQQEQSTEMTDTRCDRALAQQIADITGGQVVPPTAIEEILSLTNLEPIVSKKVERQPIWIQWKYLWIVFGSMQLEWIIRRRLGLS